MKLIAYLIVTNRPNATFQKLNNLKVDSYRNQNWRS